MTTITIDFQEIQQQAQGDALWAVRGKAMNTYAMLEHALSFLLADFGDMPKDVANLIFFKMGNTRSRMVVLEKLIRRKYGTTHSLFWNSVKKHIVDIDETRHEIIHWTVVSTNNIKDGSQLVISPSNFLSKTDNSLGITSDDLLEFIKKTYFIERLCRWFEVWLIMTDFRNSDEGKSWQEIFLQPVGYPPASNHPISLDLSTITLDNPPLSLPMTCGLS